MTYCIVTAALDRGDRVLSLKMNLNYRIYKYFRKWIYEEIIL